MSTPTKRKSKSTHRFNVILTESQYQRLKDYAEAREKDMAEVVRELIRTLPIEEKKTIE
jgi:effector-binding domain-containing protein